FDADVEFNTADYEFTVGDDNVHYDFLSIATHEVGHFLGFAHSEQPGTVMTPTYPPGSTALRNLSPDDAMGMCATFPPNGTRVTKMGTVAAEQCDLSVTTTPSGACPSSTIAGCTLSRSADGGSSVTGWAGLGLFVAMALYGRRRTSRNP